MELCFANVYKLQSHVTAMERAQRECDFKDLHLTTPIQTPRETDRGTLSPSNDHQTQPKINVA